MKLIKRVSLYKLDYYYYYYYKYNFAKYNIAVQYCEFCVPLIKLS